MRQTASSAHPGRTFDQILFYFLDIPELIGFKRILYNVKAFNTHLSQVSFPRDIS